MACQWAFHAVGAGWACVQRPRRATKRAPTRKLKGGASSRSTAAATCGQRKRGVGMGALCENGVSAPPPHPHRVLWGPRAMDGCEGPSGAPALAVTPQAVAAGERTFGRLCSPPARLPRQFVGLSLTRLSRPYQWLLRRRRVTPRCEVAALKRCVSPPAFSAAPPCLRAAPWGRPLTPPSYRTPPLPPYCRKTSVRARTAPRA